MTREWKPGDVGVTGIDGSGDTPTRFLVIEQDGRRRFLYADGDSAGHPPREDARPLVVMDPEDCEQVGRLADRYLSHFGGSGNSTVIIDALQDALRSLLAPPKPVEPKGRYAVVLDAEGKEWIRDSDGMWCYTAPKVPELAYSKWTRRIWQKVAAVKVLSEGVTS